MSKKIDNSLGPQKDGSEQDSYKDETFELMELIRQLYDLIAQVRIKELKPYKLRPMQVHILTTIKAIGENATPTAITHLEMRKLPTVTCMLSRMKKQGLIAMSNSFANKRLVRVKLTEKGEEAYRLGIKRELIRNVTKVLNDEQREQLKDSLLKLRQSCLDELNLKHPPYP